jgi:hypothetical protein
MCEHRWHWLSVTQILRSEIWGSHGGAGDFFFWAVTPCGLVGRYQRFGETCHRLKGTSALKMETICIYLRVHTRRPHRVCHNPEQHRQLLQSPFYFMSIFVLVFSSLLEQIVLFNKACLHQTVSLYSLIFQIDKIETGLIWILNIK